MSKHPDQSTPSNNKSVDEQQIYARSKKYAHIPDVNDLPNDPEFPLIRDAIANLIERLQDNDEAVYQETDLPYAALANLIRTSTPSEGELIIEDSSLGGNAVLLYYSPAQRVQIQELVALNTQLVLRLGINTDNAELVHIVLMLSPCSHEPLSLEPFQFRPLFKDQQAFVTHLLGGAPMPIIEID